MAQSLSAATSSEIEHVTRLCQRLEFFVDQPPLQVRALSHGASNQSYFVKTVQGEYVLRCYPAESTVCRQQELRCQHAAAAQGLAATPLCLNNHYQVMLSEYISGAEPFDYARHGCGALLTALAQFHQLQVQTAALDCAIYLSQLLLTLPADTRVDHTVLATVQNAAQQLSSSAPDLVLCHLDLHQGNLLWANNTLWLLDFEYSQQADSSLDLAAISLHFNLDKIAEAKMVAGYARLRQCNEPDALSAGKRLADKLPAAKLLYCGFCWLWYLALPDCQTQARYWQQQIQGLAVLQLQAP